MRLRLDTHALIWHLLGSPELSASAKTAISDRGNWMFVSTASLWEIAIKIKVGKIELGFPFNDIKALLDYNGFVELPIRSEHLQRYIDLPLHHRDPFDRVLLAQASLENLTIVTRDSNFAAYGQPLLW